MTIEQEQKREARLRNLRMKREWKCDAFSGGNCLNYGYEKLCPLWEDPENGQCAFIMHELHIKKTRQQWMVEHPEDYWDEVCKCWRKREGSGAK